MQQTNPLTRIVYTPTKKVEQVLLSHKYDHWAPLKRWNLLTGKREL